MFTLHIHLRVDEYPQVPWIVAHVEYAITARIIGVCISIVHVRPVVFHVSERNRCSLLPVSCFWVKDTWIHSRCNERFSKCPPDNRCRTLHADLARYFGIVASARFPKAALRAALPEIRGINTKRHRDSLWLPITSTVFHLG